MRPVQEMTVEFVNALNAAAAAESESSRLRRILEEEQKLVRRLKQEREGEVQTANRKFERMRQRLAEARKDVEYATVRADVAENEWIKMKKELQEARELVQLLKPENEETRPSILKRVEEKELELANALNAAAISELISQRECDKLRTMLEEEQKLFQKLKLEKDVEAQLHKRQIEEISQELADVQKNAEYATTRADLAENEWIKTKRELQKERELLQWLKHLLFRSSMASAASTVSSPILASPSTSVASTTRSPLFLSSPPSAASCFYPPLRLLLQLLDHPCFYPPLLLLLQLLAYQYLHHPLLLLYHPLLLLIQLLAHQWLHRSISLLRLYQLPAHRFLDHPLRLIVLSILEISRTLLYFRRLAVSVLEGVT